MKLFVLSCLLFVAAPTFAQRYLQLHARQKALQQAASTGDTVAINRLWEVMQQEAKIPLIENDSVYFLYRGAAKSVLWVGDFNQWGYDKSFASRGTKLGNTDVWIWKTSFPADARLDYKIIIDDTKWILDPVNPHTQWSGVGGGSVNSELRMPLYKPDEVTVSRNVPKGSHSNDRLLNSKILGYQVTYTLYLPAGHTGERLPVVYVTDGYEYTHPQLGNMVTILDNLIADQKIKPIAAVFIDHREPVNRSNNRRMEELAMNERYLRFFADEFIPHIEKNHPVATEATQRAILGNSMGGLNAAYFVFARPNLFTMAGIQSPAFYTRPQIYSMCEGADKHPIKISMTSGLINDTSEGGRRMKALLETSACQYNYREVNQGHSWGNWRNLIDDILVDLFAP